MNLLRRSAVATLMVFGGLLAGCSTHVPPAPTLPPPPPPLAPIVEIPVKPPVVEAPDPIAIRIANAEREFATGRSELGVGHLVAAREAFDRAVDLLLSAPAGARSEPRFDAVYQRLLDQITALETVAFREGDGFTETQSEPAVIDALLGTPVSEHPQPAATTAEMVAADLQQTPHDLPIAINNKVLSYVELFQGNLRAFMDESLKRGARYVPMIQDVFRAEGLPLDLAYVPLVESAFRPNALSRASAKGLWQFIQETGKENGLSLTWFSDERSDPEKATHAAAQYLKTLADGFGGDWNLALASYNAGPGRVDRAMKQSKSSDYWQITATSKYLPRETREYVPMILAAIIIARNPTQYGFDVGLVAPLAFEKVAVPDALDLHVVAEWTGVSFDEIRDLNPELRRAMTPTGRSEVKVPVGTAASVEAQLATAAPDVFVKFNTYSVKSGETLAAIARRFKVKSTDLALANQLSTKATLRSGQVLMIPRDPGAAVALTTRAPGTTPTAPPAPIAPPATTVAKTSKPTTIPAKPASTTPAAATQAATVYRVKSGDTLSSIARQFATTVTDLKRLNQLTTDDISVGEKLTVRR